MNRRICRGKTLAICMKLGVRYVTVYAFAMENFNRSPDEVSALMQLAEEKLLELCQHGWVAASHPSLQSEPRAYMI